MESHKITWFQTTNQMKMMFFEARKTKLSNHTWIQPIGDDVNHFMRNHEC